MSGLLQHLKVSAIADGPDPSQVQPSDWNAAHVFAGGNHGAIPVRDTTDPTYGGGWLASVAAGQVLISNGIGALPSWTASLSLTGTLTVTGAFTAPGATLTGDLLFSPDATYDIGKTSANRPNDVFCARHLTIGGILIVNGFGAHQLTAAGSAGQSLTVANPTSGPTAYAAFTLIGGTTNCTLRTFAQGYAPAGYVLDVAASANLEATGLGGLLIAASHASGALRFYSGGLNPRWDIVAAGDLLPAVDNTVSLGSPSKRVFLYYGWDVRLSSTAPLLATNTAADTGTVAVFNASGVLQKQSSSARYKDHVTAWDVAPAMLARFVACSPKRWDYRGQSTGAAGFIAEDLADVVPTDAGRSALLNYDADGQPESNRDFAIIGLQHLAIQDLWRRVAALEGRL